MPSSLRKIENSDKFRENIRIQLNELIQNEKFKCIVVNPLTWTTDETYTSAELNKGGILQNFRNKFKNRFKVSEKGGI